MSAKPAQRRQLAAVDPARGSPLGPSRPRCACAGCERRRRGVGVERVAVLRRRSSPAPAASGSRAAAASPGRSTARPARSARASTRRVEQAGERRGDPAEREPRRARRRAAQPRVRVVGGDRRAAAAAVDEHQAGEALRARPAAEVPGRVGVVIDPPSEWPPSTTSPPRALASDDAPQVLDLDAHAPLARERDLGVRDQLEVSVTLGSVDEAEVVVEQLLRRGLPALARSSIEWSSSRFSRRSTAQTCQPFARATIFGERPEVRRARRRTGLSTRTLPAAGRLEDPDLVVLRGRSGRRVALDPVKRTEGGRAGGGGEDREERDEAAALRCADRADATFRSGLPGGSQEITESVTMVSA